MKTSDKIKNPTFGNDDPVLVSHEFLNAMSSEVANLETRDRKLLGALGFFKSVIQSGEPWTATCQEKYDTLLAGRESG